MRPLKRNSIPLALCVFAALLTVTQIARAQNEAGPIVSPYESGVHDFRWHELRVREQEALARHARELQTLERARQDLRLRQLDAASRTSQAFAHGLTSRALPAGALGIIRVDRPREMTLLHLRGLAGSGSALLRLGEDCVSIPLRFVAGDFGGDSVSAHRAPPIRIAVQSRAVRDALLEGDDIVSDTVEVSHGVGTPGADLVLLDGLTTPRGFVINPGRSLVDDIFGAEGLIVPCEF
jgi:hypothetical protein